MRDQLKATDPSSMYTHLVDFPDMWKEGARLAESMDFEIESGELDQVVVAGMGGSAIGGDLLRTLTEATSPVPVIVNRSYDIPASVSSQTLFIASSYSGNTEETLSATRQAIERGAQVHCITSGGELLRIARSRRLSHVAIPGGLPPRAALPYSLTSLIQIAGRIGLTRLSEEESDEAIDILQKGAREFSDTTGNLALETAHRIKDRITLVYSATGLLESVNVRWRGQIAENAKTLAFGNTFPELNHNEIVGWAHSRAFIDRVGVIVLRDREDHERVQRRMNVTRDILGKRGAFWIELETKGQGRLGRMLSLIQLGDWVSLYLAVLNDVDPTPVKLIDRLKAELGES